MRNYIIADNQELTAFALQSLLKSDEQNTVHRTTNKTELVNLLKEHEASVVILDYKLFDFADDNQLLIISERFAMTSWILLSDDLTEKFLRRIIYSSNAFSILFKDEPVKSVRDAIKSASEGKRYISQRVMEMIIAKQQEDEQPAVLTTTEIEIVKAIAQGKTTKEIAVDRYSSVHTINTHRKNIFRKLNVNTAHEVMKYALRAGWIDPSEFYI